MSEIQQIALAIEHAQEMVERRDMVHKMTRNREFKKIIQEGYLEQEAIRLAHISGEPAHLKFREEIFADIRAISAFRQYLSNIIRMGDLAEAELADHQELLSEMEATGVEA